MTPCTVGFLGGCVIVYFGFLEEKGPIFCSIGLQSPSVRSASERLVDTLFLSKCEKIERMAFSDHLLIHPMLQLPGDPLLTTSKPSISNLAILGATRGRFVFSINHIFKYQQIWLCQSLRSFWTPGKCTHYNFYIWCTMSGPSSEPFLDLPQWTWWGERVLATSKKFIQIEKLGWCFINCLLYEWNEGLSSLFQAYTCNKEILL